MELHFVEFRTNFQVFVSFVPCESIENKYLCITILLITHEIWKRYYFQPITMDITIKHLFITAALMLSNNIIAQTPVFLTAGQSNADGREYVSKLPEYMKAGYKHLKFANVTSSSYGTFGERTFENISGRYSFCDVTHYFIDQSVNTDFYGIKCAYGGTAIDTAATYAHLPVWCADATWIAANNTYRGDIKTGKSLTKSLTEGFADCVDNTLSKLEGGYGQ